MTAFLLPVAAAAVCAIFGRLADVDPLRANYRRFRAVFDLTLDASVLLILGLHATLLATLLLGVRPWLGHVPPLLVGLLMLVVGNVLPRLRPNAALGVRTPWTSGSERVWAVTHHVAGYMIVVFGLLVVATALLAPMGLTAQARPDYSGVWVLTLERSRLDQRVWPGLERMVLRNIFGKQTPG